MLQTIPTVAFMVIVVKRRSSSHIVTRRHLSLTVADRYLWSLIVLHSGHSAITNSHLRPLKILDGISSSRWLLGNEGITVPHTEPSLGPLWRFGFLQGDSLPVHDQTLDLVRTGKQNKDQPMLDESIHVDMDPTREMVPLKRQTAFQAQSVFHGNVDGRVSPSVQFIELARLWPCNRRTSFSWWTPSCGMQRRRTRTWPRAK